MNINKVTKNKAKRCDKASLTGHTYVGSCTDM